MVRTSGGLRPARYTGQLRAVVFTGSVQIKRHRPFVNQGRCRLGRCSPGVAVATLVATLASAQPAAGQRPRGSPDTLAIRGDTYFLAHDALLGRAAGSPGAEAAAEYIVSRCLAMGLEPVAGRYLHPVPLQLVAAAPSPDALTITTAQGRHRFAAPRDVINDLETARTLDAFHGPVAFMDLAHLDRPLEATDALSGRVVVVNGLASDVARSGEVLNARGARGLVQLVDSATFADISASWSGRVHALLAHDGPTSRRTSLPVVVAGPRVAATLSAARSDPAAMATLLLEVQPAVRLGPFLSRNVTCRLAGSAPDQTARHVAFIAHYDHVGVQHTLDPDSIYNGFSDNAAGVAMVLSIADVLTRNPLRASTLFLFFTAEEMGLLGSDYFVETSPVPLNQLAVVLNLDAGAPPGPLSSWRVATSDSGLADVAIRVGAAHGWSISLTPARPNSDHFPFARHGVPAALLVPGSGPYDGLTAERSDSVRARWERYHEPGDEWSPDFPWSGLRRYAEVALEIARVADSALSRVEPDGSDSPHRGRGARTELQPLDVSGPALRLALPPRPTRP